VPLCITPVQERRGAYKGNPKDLSTRMPTQDSMEHEYMCGNFDIILDHQSRAFLSSARGVTKEATRWGTIIDSSLGPIFGR